MASQRKKWQVIDGPSQWQLTVGFWESLPSDPRVVNFTLVNPNRPEDRHILQMEVYVMGRGPAMNQELFFSGPAKLFLGVWEGFENNTYAAHISVGKAKVTDYAIHNRRGDATFSADVRSFDDPPAKEPFNPIREYVKPSNLGRTNS